MMATMLPPDHNIELKCRICAVDFKITSEGVPIFKTDQLEEKIKNYLHINVSIIMLALIKCLNGAFFLCSCTDKSIYSIFTR